MKLTAGQAAKAAGVSTATITRAIKRGRISAAKDEDGAWQIEPAELHRTFPPVTPQADTQREVQRDVTPLQDGEMRVELARMEERLRAAEERCEAAERDRDAWRVQAERLTMALPAPASVTAKNGTPKGRNWWSWR